MIIKPHELKFGIRAGPYPVITTEDSLAEYIEGKKGIVRMELCQPLLPLTDTLGPRIIDIGLETEKIRPVFDKVKVNKELEKKLKLKVKEKKEKEKKEKEKVLG